MSTAAADDTYLGGAGRGLVGSKAGAFRYASGGCRIPRSGPVIEERGRLGGRGLARFAVWPGRPYPLGATWDGEGVNFALFSEHAEAVELCLFAEDGRHEIARIPIRW
ncbi:MAG: hypothetical protein ACYCVM_06155, partial [Acidiferrobacter sp.]